MSDKLLSLLLAIFIMAGCDYSQDNQDKQPIVSEIDATGTEVGLDEYPERIISTAPNNTEILLDLGLKDRLVGVSDFYGWPERIKGIESVGGYTNPNVEKIMALEPDIVFAARGNPRDVIEGLRRKGIKVFAVDVMDLEDLFESLRQVGRLTGREAKASDVVCAMREEMSRVGQLVSELKDEDKPSVLVLLQESPMVAAGPDNIVDELIRLAGGRNTAGGERAKWPTINAEKLLLLNPEIIILGEERYLNNPGKVAETVSRWRNDSVWRNIAAVEAGRVYFVRTELIGQPTPRNIEGLRKMLEIFQLKKNVEDRM